MKLLKRYYLITGIVLLVLVNAASAFVFARIDLTADKRHSISPATKQLMRGLDEEVHVTLYLDGEMNAGFLRLKRAAVELLDELSVYAGEGLTYEVCNPATLDKDRQEQLYEQFAYLGISPTVIHERNRDGKSVQRLLFPWMQVRYGEKQDMVGLLKNIKGNSGEANLNISIESLEFEWTDALRRLTRKEVRKIAFIEGHGELNEMSTLDVSLALNRYFQIDRGVLGDDASVLDEYEAIIVAAPQERFSEADKYIIDQYVMHGGKVLWLLDGVRFDEASLSRTGMSPVIPLDVNLTDLLFRYGVRVNPMVVQDEQCLLVPVNVAPEGQTPDFQPMPWYFAPLLLTSPNHAITRNVAQVTGTFVSCLDAVGDNERVQRDVLLATSNATHLISAPTPINVEEVEISDGYFNLSYVPVAMALDGVFESLFAHRMPPATLVNRKPHRKESVPTRQVVVASGSVISNHMENGQPLPAGYDRYTGTLFGNRDFLVNAVLYLTDEEGWINLRNKELKIRLLNKNISRTERSGLQAVNVGLPVVLLGVFGVVFSIVRRRRYMR